MVQLLIEYRLNFWLLRMLMLYQHVQVFEMLVEQNEFHVRHRFELLADVLFL